MNSNTSALLKTKNYLLQTVDNAAKSLVMEQKAILAQMTKENKGKMDYFISVKKASAQAETMLNCS